MSDSFLCPSGQRFWEGCTLVTITSEDLLGTGLTEAEQQGVLASLTEEEQVRQLRKGRGRLLEDLHSRQQALDRLDYLIRQVRQPRRQKA